MPNAAAGPTERHAAAGSIIGIRQMRKTQRAPVAGITQLGVVELRSMRGLTLNFILEVLSFLPVDLFVWLEEKRVPCV